MGEEEAFYKMVAPDGGWGWMVVLGMALSNLITIPILQNFSLVSRDLFATLSFSGKEASIIIISNSALGYMFGIFNGPILRTFGYRKVAIAGALMMFVGLLVTSFSYEFYMFFIFYSLINSLGIGWSMSSYHLALSTYFVDKRGMAMGIAMTITGLGPIFGPLFIAYLLSLYGARGTVLVLSGIVLHCVFCGMLLQPIKWHRKRLTSGGQEPLSDMKNDETNMKHDKLDVENGKLDVENGKIRDEMEIEMQEFSPLKEQEKTPLENKEDLKLSEKKTEKGAWKQRLVQLFDLDLLQDPAFLSMCVGISIAFASDLNFSLLLPLILGDQGFNTQVTAQLQAVIGTADILSRFLIPFMVKKTSARVAYLSSLIGLIVSRFCLTLASQFVSVLLMVAMIGLFKGIRAVYMPLVIPNYVPLEKLASAQGMQNFLHGLFLMILGPLNGYVKDRTGNYILCIHIMNSLTAVTILLWAVEFFYIRSKKKNTFVDMADNKR